MTACVCSVSVLQGDKVAPVVSDVLTDIFKSCVNSEQMLSLTPAKPLKVSEIYLSKEQINAQTPGNLLHTFFTNVRPPKKVLEDQLTQVNAAQISWRICQHVELLDLFGSDSKEIWCSQA